MKALDASGSVADIVYIRKSGEGGEGVSRARTSGTKLFGSK